MAQTFDFEQPAIGRKADLAQLRQVVQALADAEVVAVVDGRLGTQGPIFLVILLDPRVLVIDVQGRGDVLGDDAGAELSRCPAGDGAVEDQPHLLGRPRSRFSRITCSKNRRPCTGRSSTWVKENSACKIEMS